MRNLLAICAGLVVTAGCIGCATGGRGGSSSHCELLAEDSVYLAGGPVYRECAVDTRARLLDQGVSPNFQPSGGRQCYTAVLEFVVDTTGVPEPETVRVTRTNDQSFADALTQMVPGLHYQPGLKDGQRVRQVVQFSRTVALVAAPAGQVPRSSSRPTC